MTSIEHAGRQTGPITLHIETQAADVHVVSDPRVTGTLIELSTADTSGPSVDAIRNARFEDRGSEIRLTLREGSSGGVVISGNNYGTITGGMTTINGVVVGRGGGGQISSGITVRAMIEPSSRLVVKTMSGDVVTRGVAAVDASTMSGDIEAEAVTSACALKTMSGDIRVSATEGRPQVAASSMSGDVTGSGVSLNASSMSGRVRQR